MDKSVVAPLIYPYANSYNNAKAGKYYFTSLSQNASTDVIPYANGAGICAEVVNLGSEQNKLLMIPSNSTISTCNAATYTTAHSNQWKKFLSSLGVPISSTLQNTNANIQIAFGIKSIDDINRTGKKIYYVDWSDQYINSSTAWTFVSAFDFSQTSVYPVMSGLDVHIEESSGGSEDSGSINSSGIESAIYTVAAVPIVLCFFFVIYKMFMRLRG